jgi:hypothetical protein
MSNRIVTATEIAAYQKFAAANNIAIEGEGGRNAELLGNYVNEQLNGAEINETTLTTAFNALRSQIVLIDRREVEYTKIFNSLSAGEQRVFASWWPIQKRFVTEGLPGAENAAIILGWMKARRYQVTYEGLDQGVQNIVSNPGRKLTLVETPTVAFTPGRHSGKSFKEEKDSGEFRPDGRKNHAKNPKIVEQSFSPKTLDKEWEIKAEALAGQTHSQTAQVKRFLVTKSNGEVDWKATYDSRVRYLEGRNGERTM